MRDGWYERWVRVLRYVDLVSDGHPSFSKFTCLAILVAVVAQRQLTLGIVIALLAASFGRSVFIAFLRRSSIEARQIDVRERREVVERRDPALGIEPEP